MSEGALNKPLAPLTYQDLVDAKERIEWESIQRDRRIAEETQEFLATVPEGKRGGPWVAAMLAIIQYEFVPSPSQWAELRAGLEAELGDA